MSHQLISSIVKGKWLIDAKFAEGYFPLVNSILSGQHLALPALSIEEREKKVVSTLKAFNASGIYSISDYGQEAPPENAPDGSIAILNIQQVITKYDQYCGPSGMLTKMDVLKRAGNNPKIKAIII